MKESYEFGEHYDITTIVSGDCPHILANRRIGAIAYCSLDKGHEGAHIAVNDKSEVVEAWMK